MYEEQRIISVISQKGGVGKTTTSINLSAFLGSFGFKTLLIDLDPQCNSSTGLGIPCTEKKDSLYGSLVSNGNIAQLVTKTPYHNLFVIPASLALSQAEEDLHLINGKQFRLKESLRGIKKEYEYIIIDCPANLGILTYNALTASNEVLVPLQCDFFALDGLDRLIESIEFVKLKYNFDLQILGFLITMYSRTRVARQCLNIIDRHFKSMSFQSMIPKNTTLSEASSFGMPVLYYNKRCKGAKAYRDLAHEVVENKISKNNPDFEQMPKRNTRFWDEEKMQTRF